MEEITYNVRRDHKDGLFCKLFGSEKYKNYALELYNSINNSNYDK